MSLVTTNNQGIKVIATNKFFYTLLESNESFVCCGEYQNREFCFKSNTPAGCAFCESDTYSPCECESCEG